MSDYPLHNIVIASYCPRPRPRPRPRPPPRPRLRPCSCTCPCVYIYIYIYTHTQRYLSMVLPAAAVGEWCQRLLWSEDVEKWPENEVLC